MDFEQAFEYASGQIKAEELKTSSQEISERSSFQSLSTASTQRSGNAPSDQGLKNNKIFKFGKF